MTNEEIAMEISKLQEQFVKNNFTFCPENATILSRITELQKQCTHSNGSMNFEKEGTQCIYCGRQFNHE